MGMSAQSDKIEHLIPLVGFAELELYPPAERIFAVLMKYQEKRRLSRLRHLGAFTHAFPGARHVRWDYTVAMLYYASLMNVPGTNSAFTIGPLDYSSTKAAFQCLALVWNAGHLPGTFAVEKGVYRYLHSRNAARPAEALRWPLGNDVRITRIEERANSYLRERDYLGIARVLGVVKLLKYAMKESGWFKEWVVSFAAPFLLDYEDLGSIQWHKIGAAFGTVRHAAYLTVDYAMSGLGWGPDIPGLLKWILSNSGQTLEVIGDTVSEVLSPIERQIYERLYHNETARKEAAIVADHVFEHLHKRANATAVIERWLQKGSFKDLKLGRLQSFRNCRVAATLRLRSHFSMLPGSVAQTEKELRDKRFELPVALEYSAWNSDVMAEPDEIVIDVMTTGEPTTSEVGKLLAWCVTKLEDFSARPSDDFSILRKLELESTYLGLMRRALSLTLPNLQMRFQPWSLAEFGVFAEYLENRSRGGVWASNARMDDPICKHIVRDRSDSVPRRLRAEYVEMQGLAKLRKRLMRKWSSTVPRQRCLLVTGSVRLATQDRDLLEFDGGIVTASCRGGLLTWYGLESKSGRSNPKHVLTSKLASLRIAAPVFALGRKHAYVKMQMGS